MSTLSRRPLLQIKGKEPVIRLANIESVIVGKQHSPQTIEIRQADGEPESASPHDLAAGSRASEQAQLRPVLGPLVDLHRRTAASLGLLELFDVRDR